MDIKLPFKDRFRSAIQKFLRPSAYILLIAFAIYPLVPYEPYKYIALFGFGMVLLRLLLDIDANLVRRLNGIDLQAKADHEKVVGLLTDTSPPTWENFRAASGDIMADIKRLLITIPDKRVQIDVLGISARYSWPMLEDHLPLLLADPLYSNSKLCISIAVCDREVLKDWALTQQVADLEKTLQGIAQLRSECKEFINQGRLTLDLYVFDTLPMWHGLMLGDKELYMGRTRWDMSNSEGPPRLHVGSREYRKFIRQDPFGGNARIEMFNNWMTRLKLRHSELRNRKSPPGA